MLYRTKYLVPKMFANYLDLLTQGLEDSNNNRTSVNHIVNIQNAQDDVNSKQGNTIV